MALGLFSSSAIDWDSSDGLSGSSKKMRTTPPRTLLIPTQAKPSIMDQCRRLQSLMPVSLANLEDVTKRNSS
jgi:hypothetical protein